MLANRRITVAVALSLLLHAIVFSIPVRKRIGEQTLGPVTQGPMVVRIEPAQPPTPEETVTAVPEARPAPPKVAVVAPRPPTPQVVPRSDVRAPVDPVPAPEPRATPQFDMMAAVNARRERRRAEEAAAAGPEATREPSAHDAATAAINRNLRSSPTEGVGGVFTILRKGTRTAEFAFNGWRPDSYRQWREVIEVDAGPGGDVERAIARRMIELIRGHYTGDFLWQSHQLGRTVTLSARPGDNEGLEDFLIREFWGTPTLKR